MCSSFFHLKVIFFIHIWFTEHWNSSQTMLAFSYLILYSFVKLETRFFFFPRKNPKLYVLCELASHYSYIKAHRGYATHRRGWFGNRNPLWLVYSSTLHSGMGLRLAILPVRGGFYDCWSGFRISSLFSSTMLLSPSTLPS